MTLCYQPGNIQTFCLLCAHVLKLGEGQHSPLLQAVEVSRCVLCAQADSANVDFTTLTGVQIITAGLIVAAVLILLPLVPDAADSLNADLDPFMRL